ncbi:MAG: ankyrin repeat domain-containing protein [Endomicrobia bacterium]|nr:ankyrin repeat domain-containing protein [Endomicrobiia bacterium]MCL2506682.1 ankyrin repeat domain-containing protein [Endomicrobiia bacterium]
MKKIVLCAVFSVSISLFFTACFDKDKKQNVPQQTKEEKVEIAKDDNQEIYSLVKSGNAQALIKYAKPKNVNLIDQDGNNVLLIAAGENNRAEIINILIEAGANTEIKNKNGYTPLMMAIRNTRTENVLALIKAGANVNTAYDKPYDDEDKTTPLMYAVSEYSVNEPRVIQALIDAGANVNAKDALGYTPLLIAARHSWLKPENLEILIKSGANIEEKDKDGYTSLVRAIRNTRAENVLVLIKAGANVNDAYDKPYDDDDKTTPLMYAVRGYSVNEPRVIRALIDAGADVNAKDAIGYTPLLIAARHSWTKPENVEILIKSGANIEEKNKDGYTPLMRAIGSSRPENVIVLIKAGANVNITIDENKITPLMYAMSNAVSIEPIVVKALIDYGADIDAKDAKGQSVFDYSRQSYSKEKVKEYTQILLDAKNKK